MGGRLITEHCTSSKSKTYHGDQWVAVEIEVLGSKSIRHIVEGETVMEYSEPQLDDGDADARKLLDAGAPRLIEKGWISLQVESHPVGFRKVELLRLAE
jgi:hypothetical protein